MIRLLIGVGWFVVIVLLISITLVDEIILSKSLGMNLRDSISIHGIISFVGPIIFNGVPAIILIMSGRRAIRLNRAITKEAIRLFEQDGIIDSEKISRNLNTKLSLVKRELARSTKKGIIPGNAEII
jgi:hypothetical protein